jgi:hypothetical protein
MKTKPLQLHIAEPCHEQWGNMTPSERGRFCDACEKHVVDFTMMSDQEIAQFFKRPSTGSVCGRFFNEQLNRPIEMPKKRIPWVKYFFQIALPAFLVSLKAGAQKPKAIRDTAISEKKYMLLGDVAPERPLPQLPLPGSIKGVVYDEHGVPIPFAKVCIKDTSVHALTDTSGHFMIDVDSSVPAVERLPDDSVQLQVTAPGFADSIVKIDFKEFDYKIVLPFESIEIIEGITVGFIAMERDYCPMPITDPYVYPNPVGSGNTLTIGFQSDSNGNMVIKVNDMEGREVMTKPVNVSKGKNKIPVDTDPNWARGFYIVQLYDPKGKKLFGEKILIQ